MRARLLVCLGGMVVGCGGTVDGAADGGGRPHADAGASVDASVALDAGRDMDAALADAGTSDDGGPDAGAPERDGTTPAPDAGVGEPPIPPLTWRQDSSAHDGRTFYGDRTGRRVFDVTFTTTEVGEKRWVQGHMNIEQVDHVGADPLMMVVVSVSCKRVGGTRDPQNGVGETENVIRGTPLLLRPQLVFTGGAPGTYQCTLSAQGGRPRPTGSFDVTRFNVESGSYLRVSSRRHPASDQSYAPRVPSDVLDDGDAFDAAPLMWTAPSDVSRFTAFGAVKLTTCTSVGGSNDPYDEPDRGPLCGLPEHELDRTAGTHVRVSFQVMQIARDGGYCETTTIPATVSAAQVHVDRDSHHEIIRRSAEIDVSTASDCTRDFRIKTYVKQLSGASVVVHRQGTITGVVPN